MPLHITNKQPNQTKNQVIFQYFICKICRYIHKYILANLKIGLLILVYGTFIESMFMKPASHVTVVPKNVKLWWGLVLWHINHCKLFNAKSSLYIYIKYIGFDWVGFYGLSTIVGYLMTNPFYTYILDMYDWV